MLTYDMAATLMILAGAVILLVTEVLRNDVVGILVILALALSGVLTIEESLSGFSSTTVIIISCMFIVGKAIIHTGIAQRVGDAIIRRGGRNETRLLTMIMGAAASVGAFMSSTASSALRPRCGLPAACAETPLNLARKRMMAKLVRIDA